MKVTKYLFLILLMTLLGINVNAQQRNVLQLPDVTTQIGKAQLLISIENTDEIVGAQFDLTLPNKVTAELAGVMTNRDNGHTVTVKRLESGAYRVLIYSDQNRPLRGQSGIVMYLPIIIPVSFEEGSQHTLNISNAVLGKATGENVLTEIVVGKITIAKLPDLTVRNIRCDKQIVNPEGRIVASWQVENIGDVATGGGWNEQISLVTDDGSNKLIATTHYDGTLNANGIVSRQAEITLPFLLGIDGQAKLQVRIVPDSNIGESTSAQSNNTGTGTSVLTVGKMLSLELSPKRIDENSTTRIALRVNRSGRWTMAETFTLTATADYRISVPESITIPANQSGSIVYLNMTDNDVLDNDSIITISVEGNGYDKASSQLQIDDDEYPSLTIKSSKSVVTEGESFQLTITTSQVSAQPIIVTLNSENSKRFSFPSTVTIPAGETSVTVNVTTVDDELPSLELSNAFTVSAPKYNKGEVIVLLKDNDLPVLELQLTPTTVSEGVGVVAVAGVLRRTTNTNSKITVKLTDDANGGLYFGNRTLELAKGIEEVHFNFGPVDNAQVDGDRTYTITASVWLSSCSCSAAGESVGSVTARLTVLDNDGPALNLTSSLSTIKEGGTTALTVSRNTKDASQPLIVTFNSNYEEGLSYNHSVIIPSGQQSATVEVTSITNDLQNDSRTVIFTVQAEEYAKGTCYVFVTDQSLPDARISDISADIKETEVGAKAKLTLEITNSGAAVLPAEVPVTIYRRGDSDAVATIYTSENIPVGSSQTLTKTITLPQAVGTHKYYAVVNVSNNIQELSYNNNTSADITITTVAPFSAVVSTDKSVYKQGEKIIITGHLTGKETANASVDLYLINDGTRQVQRVTTDAEGAFSYEWQPYTQQSGHFIVGACYPDEGLEKDMASFDVYGLRRIGNGYITCEILVGETYHGEMEIVNPCSIKQEDVHVELLSDPSDCVIFFDTMGKIGGGERTLLKYHIKGLTASTGNDWNVINARVTSSSGASMPLMLHYYCRVPQAQLDAGISRIETTIVKDSSREYPLTITNKGAGESGKISLALPSFMSVQSSQPIPSLLPNESTTIILRLSCTDKMQTNVPVSDNIGLNCENGNGVALPYTIIPVSESNGELLVDVCDEYTYYTDEKPHVAGAKIKIQRPLTKEVLYEGLTESDGTFLLNLSEGYYTLSVSADKHESYERNILIDPERRNNIVVNLSYEGGVSVDWNVVETEIEDEYTISTTITYETNVPVPILDLDIPNSIPANSLGIGESLIFYATLTNRGLITIHEAQIVLPEDSPGLLFESLQETPIDLSAQQSIVIPLKVTRVEFNSSSRRRSNSEDSKERRLHCAEFIIPTGYWDCGVDKKWYRRGGKGLNLGTPCTSVELSGDFGERSELPLLGRISGANFNPYIPNIPEIPSINLNHDGCFPCLQSRTLAVAKCGIGFIPIIGCVSGIVDCIGGVILHPIGWRKRITNCLLSTTACIVKDATYRKIINIIQCLNNLKDPCDLGEIPTSSRRKASGSYEEPSYITALQQTTEIALQELNGFTDVMLEYFGDSVWVTNTTIEEQFEMLAELTVNTNEYFTVEELRKYKPSGITESQFAMFVERLNNSTRYEQTGEESGNRILLENISNAWERVNAAEKEAVEMGYANVDEMFQTVLDDSYKKMIEQSKSVCASITLKIDQTMTLTRPAYRGTLTVFNGNEETAMTDVRLNLVVKDEDGNVATSREFQINAESLDGFEGELALPGGWTLDGKQTGKTTVLFIPTKYAAPITEKVYLFGGTLSYIDPFTGLEVTRSLIPVSLTVKPMPDLELTYLMQRDVYGDDPLTKDVVEPKEPAEFALIINNKGYGEAKNVRILTEQPKIVDNEKGLVIDFNIKNSQVNGDSATLSFGNTIANDFGTIPAHSQAYGQWWLESSLLGHFTSYKVEATHVTSYDNKDLSLLDTVTIHEMIHGFTVRHDGDKALRGYLVNDIVDAEDMPDIVYFTDATQQGLLIAKESGIIRNSDNEYVLTVKVDNAGWNYGSLIDPTYGKQKLVKVARADGSEINVDNIWQTDRTLRDGRDWLYEHRLHFVGNMPANGETFYLTFEPKPDLELAVESYAGLPEEGTVLKKELTELTVKFNKPIKAESFTTDDMTLYCQGVAQDASKIIIEKQNEQEYKLMMSEVTHGDGYYVLTVQTSGITDNEGFNGSTGKQATWIQFIDGNGIQSIYNEALQVIVMPLPLRDNMYISGNFNRIFRVDIYDIRGVKMVSENDVLPERSIYVGQLNAGIYFIRIATDKGIFSIKVIKR